MTVRGVDYGSRQFLAQSLVSDPVNDGLVKSLNRPSGNATGSYVFTTSLGPKRLELLRELVPKACAEKSPARPEEGCEPGEFDPTNYYMPLALRSARKGAQILHVSLDVDQVHDITTLDAAFVTLTKDRPDALMVPADPFLVSQRSRIAQFAIESKLPSIYTFREYIEAGGLIAYAPNYDDLFRRAASYVGKILKGAKPGELPIEQPTKFHLLINLKTARALGLTVPPRLFARADEVIEKPTNGASLVAMHDSLFMAKGRGRTNTISGVLNQ